MEEKNYVKGIIGGLIGGLICSIPWVLAYVYANMILSLLAIIIAIGVLKGYQLFKGKEDEKLPIIVIVLSLICVTLSTLVIIPILLMVKENATVSFENFKLLYSYSEFSNAIIKDYIISIFFTILGISGVVSSIKKQILEEKTDKVSIKLDNNNLYSSNNNEYIKEIKKIFTKYNALDKMNTVEKEKVLDDYSYANGKQIFNTLRMQQIILKYKGKYYFSEKYEKSMFKRFIKLYSKIMLWIIIFSIAISILIMIF